MKKFKTVLSALAALVLAACFAGCAEYKPPAVIVPDDPGGNVTPPPETPIEPADGEFKVRLLWQGREFTKDNYPRITELQAQWTDKETGEVYRSRFNQSGVASNDSLDGDYSVTLVSLPTGFTYEPNSYSATNDFKEVSISLYQLTPIRLNSMPYEPAPVNGGYYYSIDTIGAFRVELKSETDKIFFMYKPSQQGVYSFTTMVDVTADEINPILDVHKGNSQYINASPDATQDGGGAENLYTKNVKWQYEIAANEVGGVFIFRLYSTSRNKNAYPLTVDFILDRDGDFTNQYATSEEVLVTEDFDSVPPEVISPGGTFVFCADQDRVSNDEPKTPLDAKKVRLNEEDGYYYYYDNTTGVWGSRLYAKINARTELSDESFMGPHMLPTLTYVYNKTDTTPRSYVNFVTTYAEHCNADGCYPVNEEIRLFLQRYALAQRYFYDGFGWAETSVGYNSDEDSMWMYACGYYE
ncbi:MAG: hypothetical protein K2L72_05065 [Clostridia bacterium]|nr:hypothetical protein [Clostridia bacterium]